MTIETGARYVQWGRGVWHVQADGEPQTCCGKDVPEDHRETVYRPSLCARCLKHDTAVEAAEQRRKAAWQAKHDQAQRVIDNHRAGRFVVYRCKLCGQQIHHVSGPGSPFCEAGHFAEIEGVEAQGTPWVDPASRAKGDSA